MSTERMSASPSRNALAAAPQVYQTRNRQMTTQSAETARLFYA